MLADRFKQHLNKLDNLRETVVYAIKDHTGKIMKYGETAAGYFKSEGMKDILKRPYRQIMQAAKRGDANKYTYTEVKKFPSKKEARAFETQKIDQAKSVNPKACPWNKGRH
jgi:preprotein translocase subunit SecA